MHRANEHQPLEPGSSGAILSVSRGDPSPSGRLPLSASRDKIEAHATEAAAAART